jgi:hypothetical protein
MTNAWIANQLVTLYDKVPPSLLPLPHDHHHCRQLTTLMCGGGRDISQDEQITDFLDNFEWTIIPIVNADGYAYTWSTDRMWRKNRYVCLSVYASVRACD